MSEKQTIASLTKRIEELEQQVAKLWKERQNELDRYSYAVQQDRGEVR